VFIGASLGLRAAGFKATLEEMTTWRALFECSAHYGHPPGSW
jgi:hypothetical protein